MARSLWSGRSTRDAGGTAPLPDGAEPAFAPEQSARSAIRAVRFAYRTSWRVSPVRTAAMTALPIVQGLLPAAIAITIRGLVNAVAAPEAVRGDALPWILLGFGFAFLLAVTVPMQRTLELINTERLENDLVVRLLEHADGLDFAYFENPRFRDHIREVTEFPGAITSNLIDRSARCLAAVMTVVSLMAVLTAIEPGLLLWLPPVAAPYLALHWWIAKMRYDTKQAQMRTRRWAEYFSDALFDERRLPESRLLGLAPLFHGRVDDRLHSIFVENRSLHRRELFGTMLFNGLALAVIYFALWQVGMNAVSGTVTIGDVAIFAGSVGAIRTAVEQFIFHLGQFRWNVLRARHLEHFLGLSPRFALTGTDRSGASLPPPPLRATRHAGPLPPPPTRHPALVLDHVRFRYPETTQDVLHDVSFSVAGGETVALVGANGSGKSTIVKLITGLYAPDAGTVSLCGTSTSQLDRDEIAERVSVVFQQFGTYEASVSENIALGDWRRLLDDNEATLRIADEVGLRSLIDRLPRGIHTELGRAFGAYALSGGQQQLFAIARASARDVPVMVLDEPTANLDAETEFELFENFKRIAAGRATLLISHRFSTLALADRVVVLADGTCVEQGRHEDLVEAGGWYAKMYDRLRSGNTRSAR